jgi:nucleoid DNA-binding protein
MNMTELADRVGATTGLDKAAALSAALAVFAAIQEGLAQEGAVRIKDFGLFAVVIRKARKARNPRTGARMQIPPRKGVRFYAAGRLNDAMNYVG